MLALNTNDTFKALGITKVRVVDIVPEPRNKNQSKALEITSVNGVATCKTIAGLLAQHFPVLPGASANSAFNAPSVALNSTQHNAGISYLVVESEKDAVAVMEWLGTYPIALAAASNASAVSSNVDSSASSSNTNANNNNNNSNVINDTTPTASASKPPASQTAAQVDERIALLGEIETLLETLVPIWVPGTKITIDNKVRKDADIRKEDTSVKTSDFLFLWIKVDSGDREQIETAIINIAGLTTGNDYVVMRGKGTNAGIVLFGIKTPEQARKVIAVLNKLNEEAKQKKPIELQPQPQPQPQQLQQQDQQVSSQAQPTLQSQNNTQSAAKMTPAASSSSATSGTSSNLSLQISEQVEHDNEDNEEFFDSENNIENPELEVLITSLSSGSTKKVAEKPPYQPDLNQYSKVEQVPRGSDNMFAAVEMALTKLPGITVEAKLRFEAAQQIHNNRSAYKNEIEKKNLGGVDPVQAYLNELGMSETLGDAIALKALADRYNVRIHILAPSEKDSQTISPDKKNINSETKDIYLAFNGFDYDVVSKKDPADLLGQLLAPKEGKQETTKKSAIDTELDQLLGTLGKVAEEGRIEDELKKEKQKKQPQQDAQDTDDDTDSFVTTSELGGRETEPDDDDDQSLQEEELIKLQTRLEEEIRFSPEKLEQRQKDIGASSALDILNSIKANVAHALGLKVNTSQIQVNVNSDAGKKGEVKVIISPLINGLMLNKRKKCLS